MRFLGVKTAIVAASTLLALVEAQAQDAASGTAPLQSISQILLGSAFCRQVFRRRPEGGDQGGQRTRERQQNTIPRAVGKIQQS